VIVVVVVVIVVVVVAAVKYVFGFAFNSASDCSI